MSSEVAPVVDRIHLRALGTSFAVELQGERAAELHTTLSRAWSRCLVQTAPDHTAQLLRIDADRHPDQAIADLSSTVTRAAIEARVGVGLMLHAGAVADHETGRTVALVGASGAGKTTAVRHLAREFAYLTDETVALEGTTVLAYPKPLSVVVGGAVPKRQVSPDELGLGASRQGCELAAVLLLERVEEAQEPWLEPVPTLEALAALAAQTSYLAATPRPLHRLAELAHGVGGVARLRYQEADQLVPVVRRVLGTGL